MPSEGIKRSLETRDKEVLSERVRRAARSLRIVPYHEHETTNEPRSRFAAWLIVAAALGSWSPILALVWLMWP